MDLAATSTVTIAGLTGTQTADAASLAITSTSSLLGTTAGWTKDSGTLVLTVGGTATTAGSDVVVTMVVTNKATAQDAVSPTVTASIEAGTNDCTITSSAMDKPGTDLIGVTGGLDPLKTVVPTFTTKSIQQSSPLNGVLNTLTITLVTDVDLAATSTVTIAGLTGTQTADAASLAITSTSSLLGTTAGWTKDSGTLVLTVGGTATTAGSDVVVTMVVTNKATAQDAVSPTVTASIEAGTNDCTITSSAMDKPGTDLIGVTGGLDPLKTVVPTFTTKSIQQSSPLNGVLNTLTITLVTDVDLAATSTVTIAGLTGTQTADAASLAITSTSSLLGTTAGWTKDSGTLVLTVGGTATTAGSDVVVTMVVTNTATAQDAVSPTVTAQISSALSDGSITSSAMVKPGTDLIGVTGGLDPLKTVVPTFTTKSIQQSSPLNGVLNTLTITLVTDVDLAATSTVTIAGLTGTQTADAASLAITSTSSLLGTTAGWTKDSGTLVLTVGGTATTAGSDVVVTMVVTNKATAQDAVSPTVTAQISSALSDGSITSSAMVKPGTDLIGVTGGLDPLKTVVPTFTTKSIQQSSPLNGVLNTLTITLVTDVDLAATSTVTIAGLTGTQTADAASLAITSTSSLLGTTAGWTKDSGTLVLTVGGTATTAGSDVVVTMVVTNKATAQDAVSPTVTAQISSALSDGSITSSAMVKPGTDLIGVTGGLDPLKTVVPTFTTKSIQQSSPLNGVLNTLTVTLVTDVDLAATSTVTIAGLTGTQTADAASLAITSTSSLLGTTAGWTKDSGTLVLTVGGTATTAGSDVVVTMVVTNKATAQDAVSPTVTAQISSALSDGSITSSAMVKPGTDLIGVTGGLDPLKTVVPTFTTKSIQQSSPLNGVLNTLTVTLVTDVDLAATSTVTIAGLTGTQTADAASLAITSTSSLLGTTAGWTKDSGTLVLTVGGTATTAGSDVVVTMVVTNKATAQDAVSPTVTAQISSALSDGSITSSAMVKPGTDLIGVTGGLDPLKTVVPTFTTKSIQQSSPLNGVLNTLTVTLVTDVDLAATSTVTIAGLTGTQTADAASLAITSTSSLLGTTAGWTKDSGTLVLTVGGTATTAGSDVVVTVVVTNKATAQDAVSPTVTAQISSALSDGSITSSAMVKPGTDLIGVTGGLDPLKTVVPTFTTKSIQQSSPLNGVLNTLTVTLVTDVDLAATSTVTIAGLTGTQTADAASLAITSTSSLLGTTAGWTKDSGTLVLTVGGTATTAGSDVVVTMVVTNKATAQDAVSPTVTAQISSALSDGSITSSAMVKPGTDLIGVTGGLDPLKTVVPTFTTKSIQQSSPLNGVLNTLTVTLVTDVDLAATSTVTIAGLTGTQTADAASLAITSTSSLLGTTAGWTKDSGTLVLTVGGTATTAGSDVVVTMVVTNKATAQDAVSPTVTAQISSALSDGSITSSAMVKPGTDLIGVTGGLDPLKTVVPTFTTKSIQQSSPLNGVLNTLTVTLVTDVDLAATSTVTIAGLTGTQTADAASLAITSTSSLLGTTAGWTKDSGTLVLTVGGTATTAGSDVVVTMVVTNKATAQDAVSPTVTAQISSALSDGSITSSAMVKPGTDLIGVTGGLDPLKTVVPTFTTKSIQQSSPLNGVLNTLTVTLVTDVDLAATSTVTIAGLTGTQTADAASLAITSTSSLLGTTAGWTKDSGTLVLTVGGTATTAGSDVVVTMVVTNKATAQDAVSPTVTAQISSALSDGSITSSAMVKPGTDLIGVTGGLDPLKTVVPTFTTKSIQQSSPLNGVLNTLTVTLVTDVDLAATSTVTIAGLTGTQTADAASLAITSTSSLLGTTAGWTKDSGTLVLTVGGTATTAGSDVVVTMVVTNKATAQDAVSPTVTAQISSALSDGSITSSAMVKPGTDLIGVTGGLDPLKTVVPTFTTKSIQQSSPLNGVLNTLTVTLVTDVDLAATSTVTIAGLTGTQTADAASLAITSTSSLLGTTAGWTKDSGTLVLTVGGTATTAGSDVVVTMVVTNKATAQDAVSPTVTAQYQLRRGFRTGTITSSAMDKPGTDLIGVTGGLDPLKTVVPTFTTKSIQQSSPLVEVYNVITLTLASDVDLSVSSTITIWGLVASQSTDDDAYTLTSDSSVFGSSGSWTQSGGLMLLDRCLYHYCPHGI